MDNKTHYLKASFTIEQQDVPVTKINLLREWLKNKTLSIRIKLGWVSLEEVAVHNLTEEIRKGIDSELLQSIKNSLREDDHERRK